MGKSVKYRLSLVVAVGTWIIFLWLHTVTYMFNFEASAGVWGYLMCALSAMVLTILLAVWFFSFKELFSLDLSADMEDDLFDEEEEFNRESPDAAGMAEVGKRSGTLRKSMTAVSVLAMVFLAALALEEWTPFFSFYADKEYISAGFININKAYFYDILLFFVFPFWVQTIFKGLEEEQFCYKSIASACMQVAMLTIMQFLLYMERSNIWMIELAAVNLLTLAAAMRKYLRESPQIRRNAAVFLLLHAALWFGLLVLFYYPGQTLWQYTYNGNWSGYAETVSLLIRNAAEGKTPAALERNAQIQKFLFGHSNYLHSVLYYWGWKAALAVIVFLLIFLAAARMLLGKNIKENPNYLVCHAAWWSLALRILVGIPYSLGILPVPINLPFAGSEALYMDTAAFALLIWCPRDSKKAENADQWVEREKELMDTGTKPVNERKMKGLPAVLLAVILICLFTGWNFTVKSAEDQVYPVNISINDVDREEQEIDEPKYPEGVPDDMSLYT